MNNIFNLKIKTGHISLNFTKGAIYRFEKDRDTALIGFLTEGDDSRNLSINWKAITRVDLRIDLAFHCQNFNEGKIYSKEELIDLAEDDSLEQFMAFVIKEYTNSMVHADPLPIGDADTKKK